MGSCRARIHECGYDLLLSEMARGRSGSDLIFMREAAEDLLSADPVRSEAVLRWPGVSLSRWQLAPGAVQPGCIAGEQVFGHYPAQVMLADDQQPVTELAAQCADHPFADGVPSGRVRRAEDNPDADRGDYGVDGACELPGCAVTPA